MRAPHWLPAALILVVAGSASAQGWMEFVNRDEFFMVNMPKQPAMAETSYVSESGAVLPAKRFTAEDAGKRYTITVIKYPAAVAEKDAPAALEHSTKGFRSRGSQVTYDARGDNDGIDGHMMQLTNADKSRSFVSMTLYRDRLYILEATVPQGATPPGQFQQSLFVLDEKGGRVRYRRDASGKKIRVVPGTGGQAFE
jgi:hypothetical protein